MNFNFFPTLLNIQENTSSILEDAPSIIESEQISMWQLIWGYDSISGEYSLTSLVVMSLLFLFSFIAIYVFIERFMTIQRALKGEKDFMQKINDFVLKGNISGVAPMLGFLGTVLGMVKVFQNMSKEKTFEIASLSGGIMEAMITTVGGLIVGIVAYVAYNYLVSKVEKVIHNMEGASIEFLDILEAPGK